MIAAATPFSVKDSKMFTWASASIFQSLDVSLASNRSKAQSFAPYSPLATGCNAIDFAEMKQCCGERLDLPVRSLRAPLALRLKCENELLRSSTISCSGEFSEGGYGIRGCSLAVRRIKEGPVEALSLSTSLRCAIFMAATRDCFPSRGYNDVSKIPFA